MTKKNSLETGLEIAVIGMAGTFPGAKNLEESWENLKNGVESISFFSNEELTACGISEVLLNRPNNVFNVRIPLKEIFKTPTVEGVEWARTRDRKINVSTEGEEIIL